MAHTNEPRVVPATVVIPTVGRPMLLRACLESLAACLPRAEEIVVVDQSGGSAVEAVVAEFAEIGAWVCADDCRGRSRATNVGVRHAHNDFLLHTDDDCTVSPNWIGAALRLIARYPRAIITGRVLPAGDPRAVPTAIADEEPRDYTGTIARGALYSCNMVCSRSEWLGFGGFDEGFAPAAEDNDLCFRWLKAGRSLRYEPSLVIWHHDWRNPEQIVKLYRGYAYGEGFFYGKHLREGETRVLAYLLSDLRAGIRARAGSLLRLGGDWWDWRLGVLPWVLVGTVDGIRRRPKHLPTQ